MAFRPAIIVQPLYWLDQIPFSRHLVVGDKAFHLSNLVQKGYPTLPGCVVPANLFREFLASINWLEPLLADLPDSFLYLDVSNPRQLQAIARQIQQAIETAALPEGWLTNLAAAASQFTAAQPAVVILRPSLSLKAIASNRRPSPLPPSIQTAGLLDVHICLPQVEPLSAGLKRIWADLFRARTLFYWQRVGIQLQQIHLAVLVQPLPETIVSGSLHIQNNRLEIQSTWGVGVALSRGDVYPDLYQIELESGTIQRQYPGQKTLAYGLRGGESSALSPVFSATGLLPPVLLNQSQQSQYALTDNQLQQLIHLARQAASDFGTPLMLEWAFCHWPNSLEEPHLYLTQMVPQVAAITSWELLEKHNQAAIATAVPSSAAPALRGLGLSPGQFAARALVVRELAALSRGVPAGAILVVPSLTPDWIPRLQQVAAIVVEQGGMTSHGAIIARELGIPAVTIPEALRWIKTGDWLMVDGLQGEVYLDGQEPPSPVAFSQQPLASAAQPAHAEADEVWPNATQLMVNLFQPDRLEQIATLPLDGVGLLRAELMAMTCLEQYHPQWWLQQGRQADLIERLANQVEQFSRAFLPRPIFYRSLDLRSHEFRGLEGSPETPPEANPMLGQRGTFSYVLDPMLFDLELQVLYQLHQAGYTNLCLMLPFVRTVEEFLFCRQRVEQVGLTKNPYFQLWIMAEVPSVLFLLPEYVRAGVQGISIGSNDLTQLLLGVDRDQSVMAAHFDERHPAVLQAILQLVQMAKQLKIPCSICGQAPARYPELIQPLVEAGITSISVELEAIDQTRRAIQRAERQLLLQAARLKLEDRD